MDTPSWPTTSLPPLVAMVLQDPSHIDLSAGFGDVGAAGSAQWPLVPTGPAQAILNTLRHAAQMLGCAVPETLCIQAGQLFYHNGRLEEVRLRGTCPDPRPGELFCLETSWSTPTPPCLQPDSDTTLQLDPAEAGRSHLSALVVTDEAAPQGFMMICTWAFLDAVRDGISREPLLGSKLGSAVAWCGRRLGTDGLSPPAECHRPAPLCQAVRGTSGEWSSGETRRAPHGMG